MAEFFNAKAVFESLITLISHENFDYNIIGPSEISATSIEIRHQSIKFKIYLEHGRTPLEWYGPAFTLQTTITKTQIRSTTVERFVLADPDVLTNIANSINDFIANKDQ